MKTRFTLRIEEDLLQKLKIASIKKGMTTSDYIVYLITLSLKSEG